tara:strand:- start:1987 stop:2811 length:825 start_codon:yes stop_codon:yes gene_type:complete
MLSGIFVEEKVAIFDDQNSSTAIEIKKSVPELYSPTIKLKATSSSERRVDIRAKTTGEVVVIGGKEGDFVAKDTLLCQLGIVELNRTEVKAPFGGFIESIVKPGNFLDRGQVCATIIDLDPIKFIAEIPEVRISDVKVGQNVLIELITGELINGKLSFVSKSASPQTKTFRVESEINNPNGAVKDGITATITIKTDPILSHKISPSILDLDDSGNIGVKILTSEGVVKFVPIVVVEDLEDGLWISGISNTVDLIVKGHGFVEDGQEILTESNST